MTYSFLLHKIVTLNHGPNVHFSSFAFVQLCSQKRFEVKYSYTIRLRRYPSGDTTLFSTFHDHINFEILDCSLTQNLQPGPLADLEGGYGVCNPPFKFKN